jgi:hypothetical protein
VFFCGGFGFGAVLGCGIVITVGGCFCPAISYLPMQRQYVVRTGTAVHYVIPIKYLLPLNRQYVETVLCTEVRTYRTYRHSSTLRYYNKIHMAVTSTSL